MNAPAQNRLARPAVRHAQARRHRASRLRARCRPCAADRALPRRREHPRRGAHHRGRGRGARRRRLARRRSVRALLMQSSGVGNCINMLSLMRTCRFPMLMFITMRGEWEEFNPWQVPMGSIVEPVLKLCEAEVYRAREAGRGRRARRARGPAGLRRRAHRRRAAVAGTDRQEGLDQMSQRSRAPRRHGHAGRRPRRRSAGRARPRLDHLGSGGGRRRSTQFLHVGRHGRRRHDRARPRAGAARSGASPSSPATARC